MEFQLEPDHRNVPDDELLEDLVRVAKDIGKEKVTIHEYNDKGKFHNTTLTRRFGSWLTALEKAGLKRTRNYRISDEELFKNLEQLWERLGRQPKHADFTRPLSLCGYAVYPRRFGTYRKALEAFIASFEKQQDKLTENPPKSSLAQTSMCDTTHTRKTSRHISWRLRFIVMRRDSFKCKICGRSPATVQGLVLHVDHIHPWSKGGETLMENLQTLCEQCNIGKSNLLQQQNDRDT